MNEEEEEEEEEEEQEPHQPGHMEEGEAHEGAAALLAEHLEEVLEEEKPESEEHARAAPGMREVVANPAPCCPTQGAPSR
jgi:hypothetical protein